jgi:K+-transporting ATPase c subunit
LIAVAVVALLLHPDADLPSNVNSSIIVGGSAIIAVWLVTPAAARRLPEAQVRDLVARITEGRTFGLLGEPRVNVLRLNLALDQLAAAPVRQ